MSISILKNSALAITVLNVSFGVTSMLLPANAMAFAPARKLQPVPVPVPLPVPLPVPSQSVSYRGIITTRLTSPQKCLDVTGASTQAGSPLISWTCNGGSNEKFSILPETQEIRVYSGTSNESCLDAGDGSNGARLKIQSCNGTQSQKFEYIATSGELKNVNGQCVDVSGLNKEDGASVIVWYCNGGVNQKWDLGAGDLIPAPAPAPVPAPTPTVISDPVPVVPSPSTSGALAELPRINVDTTYPPAPLRQIRVSAGGDLQAALDQARGGDEILLESGATFTGSFTLRARPASDTGVVVLRTDTSSIPAQGTRVTPAIAASFAKILAQSAHPALQAEPGSHDYRVVGVEVMAPNGSSPTDLGSMVYKLVDLQSGVNQSENIILDRMFIHGQVNSNVRRCVALNGGTAAVIDSDLRDCYSAGFDTQAIAGWLGTGPYLIQNNFLSASTEIVAFGGGGVDIAGRVPSDITIRQNHFYKPLTGRWLIGGPDYISLNKNMFESKSSKRVLMEANVFENQPVGDNNQLWPIILKSVPNGDAAQQTADYTLAYNKYINMGAGYGFVDHEGGVVNEGTRRIFIHDELWVNMSGAGVDSIAGMTVSGNDANSLRDVTLDHITLVTVAPSSDLSMLFRMDAGGGRAVNFKLTNSVIQNGKYGIALTNAFNLLTNPTIAGNLVFVSPNTRADGYPSGNTQIQTTADQPSGSMDPMTGRVPASVLSGVTTLDGKPAGADVDAVERAVTGVRSQTVP